MPLASPTASYWPDAVQAPTLPALGFPGIEAVDAASYSSADRP
jgi:hypothetical protein